MYSYEERLIPTVVYLSIAGVFLIYSLISVPYHFYYFAKKQVGTEGKVTLGLIYRLCFDKHTELSKRSSILNFISAVGFTIIIVDGYLVLYSYHFGLYNYPCTVSLVLKYVAWVLGLGGFMARGLRLYLQILINKGRQKGVFKALQKKDTESEESRGNASNFLLDDQLHQIEDRLTRFEQWERNEMLFVRAVLIIAAVLVLLNVAIGSMFGWYASDSSFGCGRNEAFSIMWAFIGFYAIAVCPLLLYVLNRQNDAYYLKDATVLVILAGIPAYILYFIIWFAVPEGYWKDVFDADNMPFIIVAFMHFYCITMPVLKDNAEKRDVTKGYSSFVEVLARPDKYDRLKECAEEEFSSENTTFWDSYVTFMRKLYFEFARYAEANRIELKHVPGLHKPQCSPVKDLAALRAELIKHDSKILLVQFASKLGLPENQPDVKIPMKVSLASGFVKMYQAFVSIGAVYELNILNQDRKEIEPFILALAKKLDDYSDSEVRATKNSMVTVNKSLKKDIDMENVYIVFHDSLMTNYNAKTGELDISVHIFDKIKDAVLANLYDNTYVRYLNKRAKALKGETEFTDIDASMAV